MTLEEIIVELDGLCMDFEQSIYDESISSFVKTHKKNVEHLGDMIEKLRDFEKSIKSGESENE